MVLILSSARALQAQNGKLFGTVTEDGEALQLTPLQLKQGPTIVKQSMTDVDGKYEIALIPPGTYQLVIMNGEDTFTYEVNIASDETEILNPAIAQGGVITPSEEIFTISPENPVSISREMVQVMKIRSPEDMVAIATPGIYQPDQGDPLNIRGTRSGATTVFVNGIKMRGDDGLPLNAIEQIDVLTSGVPASFGDVSGGVILIETRGGLRGSKGKWYTRQERRDLRDRRRGHDKGSFWDDEADILAYHLSAPHSHL